MGVILRIVVLVSFCSLLIGCNIDASENPLVFVTHPGMGVDKWASVWLIKRHIAPNADIVWIPDDQDSSDEGVLFDTEKALYKRTGRASTFEALIAGFKVEIPYVPELIQLIHDIEINYWEAPGLVYSDHVESQFRQLQAEFGQEKTPSDCYLAFFDNLETQMPLLQKNSPETLNALSDLIPKPTCAKNVQVAKVPRTKLVAEWPIETVLTAIKQGKRIVFIDVRESDEFVEHHIPGSINIQMRDFKNFDLKKLGDAELVVPYCIKDFRGFEMARLLKQNGVEHVALLRPYGLKGWMSRGLPTAGKSTKEDQALMQLATCAKNTSDCLKTDKKV